LVSGDLQARVGPAGIAEAFVIIRRFSSGRRVDLRRSTPPFATYPRHRME
jgi:hypothetical protein